MSFLKFWKKGQERTQAHENLKRLGLTTITDEKFGARTALYENFCQFVTESQGIEGEAIVVLNEITSRISQINNVLHQAAIPYGRAGTSKGYSKLASGWSELYTRTLDVASSVKNSIRNIEQEKTAYQPEMQKNELVLKLRYLFEAYYLKYALIIASVSWMAEDVAPSWATIIQAPPMMQGYPPNTIDRPPDSTGDLVKPTKQRNAQDWGPPVMGKDEPPEEK